MNAVVITPVGPAALLIECVDPAQARAWYDELWQRRERGEFAADDIIPGARTVLVDGVADPSATAGLLAGWQAPAGTGRTGHSIDVPVHFDGPDLDDVAELWETSPQGVVDRLTTTTFSVAFCGFAPGFGYLTGLPAQLSVPRLDTPRPQVPAGSVGLAGGYAGIYPTASPGGWRLVGRTDAVLFDVHAEPPALLTPGTTVRLRAR